MLSVPSQRPILIAVICRDHEIEQQYHLEADVCRLPLLLRIARSCPNRPKKRDLELLALIVLL